MDIFKFNNLIKKIHKDENAFCTIYDFYYKRLVGVLSKKYNREIVEDCVQEFFYSLVKNHIDHGYIKNPTSWMFVCCINLIKTKLRQDTRYEHVIAMLPTTEEFLKEESNSELFFAIQQLDKRSQDIIVYYYFYGYSLREIADILNVNYALVRKAHTRILKKLKKFLTEVSQFGG